MQRTFKQFSIVAGGTPQPLIGTSVAGAAVGPFNPTQPGLISVQVGDSSMFRVGDYALFQTTTGTNSEQQIVKGIPDGTHIQVPILNFAHPVGDWVSLAVAINSVYVQGNPAGNVGGLFIGTSPTLVKGTFAFVIAEIVQSGAGVQPNEFLSTRSSAVNADNIGQLFIDGTTSDKYLPSIGVV